MNEFTNTFLQYSYSPTINVYIVWILGGYVVYKMTILWNKTIDDLSDLEKKKYKGFIKNGEINKFMVGIWQLFAIPWFGVINDIIFIWIGGPAIVVYNKLWWGQFLSLDTILSFLNS